MFLKAWKNAWKFIKLCFNKSHIVRLNIAFQQISTTTALRDKLIDWFADKSKNTFIVIWAVHGLITANVSP